MVKLGQSESGKVLRPSEAKAAEETSYLISSDEEALHGGIAIYGPRRCGKSHTACTVSEFYPEDEAELGTKHFELADLAWVPFDAGATAFMPAWKLRCPNVVDVIRLIKDNDPQTGALKAIDVLAKTDATWLVMDTVSMLDKYLSDWAATKVNDDEKGWEIYRHMLNAHKRIYVHAMETGKRCLFLCHSKALSDIQGTGAAAKNATNTRKASYAVAPEVVPDITGQSATVYLGNCAAQLVVQVKIDPQTKAKKRQIYLGNVQGFEGGSRWEAIFGPNEAVEPNLKKLLARVSAANAG